MNHYLTQEELDRRLRTLALEVSIESIDGCIKTLETIKRILESKTVGEDVEG